MSPNRQSGERDLHQSNPPPDQVQAFQSPCDDISQLTGDSNPAPPPVPSPIGPADQGIPKTPERRVINSISEELFEEGYDSDGQRAPWEGIVEEDYDGEDAVGETERTESTIEPAPLATHPSPNPTNLTVAAVMQMKMKELKDELVKRGLSVRGRKRELQDRLKEGIVSNVPMVLNANNNITSAVAPQEQNLAGDTFDTGARWELLSADEENEVEGEVLSIDGCEFRGPTLQEGETIGVKRYNYAEEFDRDPFTGIAKQPKIWNNGRVAVDRDGNVIYEERGHINTVPNIDFCKEHDLDLTSHPAEWFQAFLPIKNKRGGNSNSMQFSMESCLSWTNTKARIQNAGLGGMYSDYVDFTLDELMKHTALYLLQGLSPSPQVEMKFKSSVEDPINGNDLVHRAFGAKSSLSVRRHKHFKAFFACVDPLIPTPSRETHPNWKIHPLLKHMNNVGKKAVHLGRDLSSDEQTIGFQGHHKDKLRVTYKTEGDGFMADCICSDGYTYNFHFRHQPPSQKLMRQGLSGLHARVVGLVSQLPNKNYTLTMDNLYNSAKFYRHLYSMEQRVMGHGVTRRSGRGVPECVKQKEVTSKQDLQRVKHTVKVAVLKGDSVCKPLVCISLYDSKPVYILTMAASEIRWIAKKRKVWHKGNNKYVWITYLRLNVIDFYNYNMGSVDLADQLRNTYRYDTQWHRNRKWWWAVWWWGFQVLLTNAYKVYCGFHETHKSTAAMTHYEFIKSIVLAWMDQEMYWPKKRKKRRSRSVVSMNEANRRTSRRMLNLPPSSLSSTGAIGEYGGSATASSATSDSATVQKRNTTMNDLSLDPHKGSLKCRLNSFVSHYPQKSGNKRAKCQLHRWARGRSGKEVRGAGVQHCSECQVDLCYACWRIFHEKAQIIEMKEEIAKS